MDSQINATNTEVPQGWCHDPLLFLQENSHRLQSCTVDTFTDDNGI